MPEHVVLRVFIKWDEGLQDHFRWEAHPNDCPGCAVDKLDDRGEPEDVPSGYVMWLWPLSTLLHWLWVLISTLLPQHRRTGTPQSPQPYDEDDDTLFILNQ